MKLHFDYSCPHCGATPVVRTRQVTVFHRPSCPRSQTMARPRPVVTLAYLQRSSDRRGRCTVCGGLVPVAASHRHPLKTPKSEAIMRAFWPPA
jgi:hypothetical protein